MSFLPRLFFVLILAVALLFVVSCSCGDDDDDDDSTSSDDDDDNNDDDNNDDNDDDNDTTPEEAFNYDTWAPCDGTNCSIVEYATSKGQLIGHQFSNLPGMSDLKIDVYLKWVVSGDVTTGDIDLTRTGPIIDPPYVLVYFQAIQNGDEITYDTAYVSVEGSLTISQTGIQNGDTFSAAIAGVKFAQCAFYEDEVGLIDSGMIGRINAASISESVVVNP